MCGMRIYHCYRTTEVPEGVHRPHQVVAAHSYVRSGGRIWFMRDGRAFTHLMEYEFKTVLIDREITDEDWRAEQVERNKLRAMGPLAARRYMNQRRHERAAERARLAAGSGDTPQAAPPSGDLTYDELMAMPLGALRAMALAFDVEVSGRSASDIADEILDEINHRKPKGHA